MPSPESSEPAPGGELQFERAEFSGGANKSTCANCKGPASPEYHELAGKIFCTACRQRIEASLDNMRASENFPRSFLWGLGAAVLGALIFYAISALTGYQIGLIAVVVGWLVGKAVRKGSGSLGGRKYQIMAVLLTYASIASTSVPAITKYLEEQGAKAEKSAAVTPVQTSDAQPVRVVHVGYVRFYAYVFALSLALPFLNITRDILGFVIIAIGLWEAWKFTRAATIQFKGPFSVSAS